MKLLLFNGMRARRTLRLCMAIGAAVPASWWVGTVPAQAQAPAGGSTESRPTEAGADASTQPAPEGVVSSEVGAGGPDQPDRVSAAALGSSTPEEARSLGGSAAGGGLTATADGGALEALLSPARRVVHRFDFDERAAGNLEDIPMYWEPLRAGSFPRFAGGAFDESVGRTSPPSFHLESAGRNVAFHYTGPATRVRSNSQYRIVGYILPDRLNSARACLSAHYLDAARNPIPGTTARSAFVGPLDGGANASSGAGTRGAAVAVPAEGVPADGAAPTSADWVEVEMNLPPAPVGAYTIGVAAWVLQESTWNGAPPARHHIARSDVAGGAWFDDITVHALPRVELTSSSRGNVLTGDGPAELIVTVADQEGSTLSGVLTVRSVAGETMAQLAVPVLTQDEDVPLRVPVAGYGPGIYTARLEVREGAVVIAQTQLTVAVVAPLAEGQGSIARPFGVVVDAGQRTDPAVELSLLRQQGARSAKLPVWSGLAQPPPTPAADRAAERLVQELVRDNFALVGVFAGPPREMLEHDGAYPRSLLELLTEDRAIWRDHLAAAVAPNAGTFRAWQLGPDGGGTLAGDARVAAALDALRGAMREFLTAPLLVAPGSALREPEAQKLPAQHVTLTLQPAVGWAWLRPRVEAWRRLGYEQVSVYVEPLATGRYARLPRLAQWVQRLVAARHAGADTVYVPQTWHVLASVRGDVVEPTEEYVLFQTVATMLADAAPGPSLRVTDGVEAMAFYNGDRAVLALWDTQAPPEGRVHAIQLGRATRQVDAWGRSTPLEQTDDGRQLVRLSLVPVFVDQVERWLVDFQASVTLTPDALEYGREPEGQKFSFASPAGQGVSGSVRLTVPRDWEVQPANFTFQLSGQRLYELPLRLRPPHSEGAGVKQVVAQMTLSPSGYYLEVPLPVTLGLADVEVAGLPIIEGDNLILRHIVTNRSSRPLSFRGSASVPGRERQYRPFTNLPPGERQTVEYRFLGGAELAGRSVRLVLREVADGPRMHNLELQVP
ncbi:MAG TPA: hypothetical protein PKK06_04885 [Phycisphaerae bacterium]|nr:hypothetical protein [Phycisphaerae bacterium]HNU45175.1 hypothetical protein [Phycisphaerae bacterium]